MNDPRSAKILLVDDNEAFLQLLVEMGKEMGFDFTPCTDPHRALNMLSEGGWDTVVVDLSMPQMDGLKLLKLIQDIDSRLPVVIITQYGSSEKAVQALKQGAYHYFEKPIRKGQELFWKTLEEAVLKTRQRKELDRLRREKALGASVTSELLGVSENIRSVRTAILEIADFDIDVLITGETGTGKGLVARALHYSSKRRAGPFWAVNCSELPEGLLESNLFGYEKGAYTGAVTRGVGYFELAHGGTLFLDEVGDASPALQTKLLRVLEEKTFQRLGSGKRIRSDFRLVTATNQDLKEALSQGRFRRDLYYRINAYRIHLEPLRNRKEDIVVLARHFIERFNEESKLHVEGLTEQAEEILQAYPWPGNVRELRNVVVRACVACKEGRIQTAHLSRHVPLDREPKLEPLSLDLKEMEKKLIRLAFERTGNNQTRAARLLGISRNTLINKLKAYNLKRKTSPDAQK